MLRPAPHERAGEIMHSSRRTRRDILLATAATGAGFMVSACGKLGIRGWPRGEEMHAETVSPGEDLMREHGVLDRVLLIYEEALRRHRARRAISPRVLGDAAGIIRRFIEDYHEKLEEDYVFPYFEKAGKLVELVSVLRQQHQRGRRLTARIASLSAVRSPGRTVDRAQLGDAMQLFIRMYRPHAAREDTVLFPAFHELVSEAEYRTLGEAFEDRERSLFGPRGFESVVEDVARLERDLGIHELSRFTPPPAAETPARRAP
jgi:hemerythrin-like domain-containing protein